MEILGTNLRLGSPKVQHSGFAIGGSGSGRDFEAALCLGAQTLLYCQDVYVEGDSLRLSSSLKWIRDNEPLSLWTFSATVCRQDLNREAAWDTEAWTQLAKAEGALSSLGVACAHRVSRAVLRQIRSSAEITFRDELSRAGLELLGRPRAPDGILCFLASKAEPGKPVAPDVETDQLMFVLRAIALEEGMDQIQFYDTLFRIAEDAGLGTPEGLEVFHDELTTEWIGRWFRDGRPLGPTMDAGTLGTVTAIVRKLLEPSILPSDEISTAQPLIATARQLRSRSAKQKKAKAKNAKPFVKKKRATTPKKKAASPRPRKSISKAPPKKKASPLRRTAPAEKRIVKKPSSKT